MAVEWPSSIASVDGGVIKIHKQDAGIRLGLHQGARDKPRCVAHTTESPTRPAYAQGVRPHFDVGPDIKGGRSRIVQYVPFGYAATALRNLSGGTETNRLVICQIEQIAYTTREVWLPSTEMVVQMASIAEWLTQEFGVPQKYPYDPKDVAIGIWATQSNPWRRSGKFETTAGWHPHAAVPENDHWDCGGESIPTILKTKPAPPVVEAHQLMASWWEETTKHRESDPISPHFRSKKNLFAYMVKDGGLRYAVRKHLRQGHRIRIATRQVQADKVR